ncbi:metallopeptidase family protein [Leptolyngbya sp. 15MV]|nr:metallopeptidase family protein [Leptolyngbya sp. 15MV]
MRPFDRRPPTADEMEAVALESVRNLPAQFREQMADVVVRVEEFATREQLDSVDIASKWQLTGLYDGRPIAEQSQWQSGDLPPMIFLFRQPLVREWRETGVDMDELIHHVVVHEAGHHFGFSDDDMHALEDEEGED